MITRTKVLAAIALTVVSVAGCEKSTEIDTNLYYNGALTGGKERPTPTTSTATGVAHITVTKGMQLTYYVSWTFLTGTVSGAHIHGPADANNIANVLVDFSALPVGSSGQTFNATASGSASGTVNVGASAVITGTVSGDSLMKLLNAGLLYVNVHTAANGGGEIRAQLLKQ
jgi:hypothetical protein